MRKRSIVLLCGIVMVTGMPFAGAHDEHGGKEKSTERCDSWYRRGHFTDANNDGKPDEDYKGSHEHDASSDINELRPVANTEIHSHSGHHVVRNDYGYIEVVGGQTYKGPDPQGRFFPGQGGYVQGEIDVAPGAPDVDFFAAAFGPKTEEPPSSPEAAVAWVNASYAKLCIDALGRRVERQSRNP